MFNIISTENYIGINYIEGYSLAIAEMSKMHCNKWYFNRLSVPVILRNKGIATELMKKLIQEADKNKITIVCDVLPYGDLNRKQLIKFYQQFGFKKCKDLFDLVYESN